MVYKPIFLLIIMLVLSYLLGSILAYPLFEWLDNPNEHPFHKLARHCSLFCGLVLSFVLVRVLNVHKETLFGFNIGYGLFFKQLFTGLIIGCLILIVVEAILLLFSVHEFDPSKTISFSFIINLITKGLITGLIVGLIEEVLFRGTIYKSIEKQYSIAFVIVCTALIYAAVHFIKFPVISVDTEINWLTGPGSLITAVQPLFSISIWDTFLTLFLLGVLLAFFRARYHSIAYCIGIHAGIVMMIKTSRKLTNFNTESNWAGFVNNTDHQLGFIASIVLGLCCVYFYSRVFSTGGRTNDTLPSSSG